MSRLDELRRVAGLVGIATRHVDALGVVHEPGEETLARLIAAFGLPADPGAAEEALAAEPEALRLGVGGCVIVAEEDAAPALDLQLPDGTADVDWHCRCETGEDITGHSVGARLSLPAGMPLGYHRLGIAYGGGVAEISLVVAPASCHIGEGLQPPARSWGLTTQLYGLCSNRNWGIGDFTDLGELCRAAGGMGAATVGINPLHALFAAEPRHISPYSPSSRAWLHYLYLDPARIPGFAEDAVARSLAPEPARGALRQAALIDHAAVAALKRPVLEALFGWFRAHAQAGALGAAFRKFCCDAGVALTTFATFEALQEHFIRDGGPFSWQAWPPPFRDPHSAAVAEFAAAHSERIEFFQFLQWQADCQLAGVAAAGRESGLAIGLYRDLAVGVNPNGAEAWADRDLVVPGAAIGAPPDALSRRGQNWGLAPLNPLALKRRGFAPLVAALRANLRHAGLLRIDHAMSLQRLYWVPSGEPATAGAYVNYPFREMLRLLALESRRHRCAIIGEDLGTVPEGFRETMRASGVLSYRILMFERYEDGGFVPPHDYPPLAAAAAATHDLATLKGYWLGYDLDWRRRLGLYPDAAAEARDADERRRDRRLLLAALEREGLLPPERCSEFLARADAPVWGEVLGHAIHAYLARSRACLALVQIEDVGGDGEQANLPGTTDGHPNWRRRLTARLDSVLASPEVKHLAALMAAERGHPAR